MINFEAVGIVFFIALWVAVTGMLLVALDFFARVLAKMPYVRGVNSLIKRKDDHG